MSELHTWTFTKHPMCIRMTRFSTPQSDFTYVNYHQRKNVHSLRKLTKNSSYLSTRQQFFLAHFFIRAVKQLVIHLLCWATFISIFYGMKIYLDMQKEEGGLS